MSSIYTAISKRIGWDERKITVPTIEEARELYNKVEGKDLNAFEKCFEIYRHASLELTAEQQGALKIIGEAYRLGTEIWNGKKISL